MKKIYPFLAIIFAVFLILGANAQAATATKKPAAKPAIKKTVKKATPKAKTAKPKPASVKWAASGIKALGSMAAFDYSYTIRNAFMKKVENYARRNNIKIITDKVVNSMRE